MKRIVCIGGWGHWIEVFQTLENLDDVKIVGAAPAFDGEDMGSLSGYPLMKNVPMFGNMDQLLRQVDAKFVIISTRPGHIASAVIRAAEAGLDIISEKPLGVTLEENAAVAEALEKNRARLMAIFSMRALPVFQTARRLVQEGAIGRPVLINARKSYKYGDEKARPEWFGRRSEYGGTWPWVGIHALDMICFTTGLQISRLAALQKNQVHLSRPDCEDTCCGIFELEGGAQATVSVDYFRPANAGSHGDDWIRIVGTDGIIEARANENSVMLLKESESPKAVLLDIPESLFIPFLNGEAGLTNQEDAVSLTRACLMARQSADESRILENF